MTYEQYIYYKNNQLKTKNFKNYGKFFSSPGL